MYVHMYEHHRTHYSELHTVASFYVNMLLRQLLIIIQQLLMQYI